MENVYSNPRFANSTFLVVKNYNLFTNIHKVLMNHLIMVKNSIIQLFIDISLAWQLDIGREETLPKLLQIFSTQFLFLNPLLLFLILTIKSNKHNSTIK